MLESQPVNLFYGLSLWENFGSALFRNASNSAVNATVRHLRHLGIGET